MIARRFDRWLDRGDYSFADISIFRIVYAVVTAAFMPSYSWISRFDDAFFRPPPGPIALLDSFPGAILLNTLDGLIVVAVFFVLVGLFTRTSSIILSILLLTGEGLAYSFGKIDHSILFVLAPLFMASAGWGNRFSLDSARKADRFGGEAPQWILRTFALVIGAAFTTGALPKIHGGWLDWSTQATYAYQVQRVVRGRSEWLATPLSTLDVPVLWEMLDWATIALELGLIFLLVTWPTWRFGLAMATFFHLGVLLSLNIDFWMNVVAYGAFVKWSAIPTPRTGNTLARFSPGKKTLVCAAIVWVGIGAILSRGEIPLTESLGWVVVVAGAGLAGCYLVYSLVRLGRGQVTGELQRLLQRVGVRRWGDV